MYNTQIKAIMKILQNYIFKKYVAVTLLFLRGVLVASNTAFPCMKIQGVVYTTEHTSEEKKILVYIEISDPKDMPLIIA